jgi:hypothetical protein
MSTADVAVLGLQVDSTQVATASKALAGLTSAANQAAGASAALTNAGKPAGAAMATLSKSANDNEISLRGQREALRGLATDIGLLSPAFGGAAASAAALYIENAHLFEGIGSTESALGRLLTPTNLAIGAFAGLAVGAGMLVESAIKSQVALGDLADRTQTTVSAIHALQSAASFKGIDTDEFTKGMEKFGELSAEARENMGSMAELFRANGVAAGSFGQNISTAADLIKNTNSEAQKYAIIQQLGLPPTHQWVTLLSQGSAGIAAATAEAQKFGSVADDALIAKARAADENWNRFWTNFKSGAQNATLSTIDLVSSLSDKLNATLHALTGVSGAAVLGAAYRGELLGSPLTATSDVSGFYKGLGGAGTGGPNSTNKGTVNPDAEKNALSLDSQRIGVLSNLATVEDTVRQKENEIALARLAGVKITSDEAAGIIAYTRAQALGTNAIQQQIDSARIAAATVGLGVGPAAAYATVQEKINEAVLKGAPLTAAQIAQLRDVASVLSQATTAAATYKLQSDVTFARSQLGMSDSEAAIAAKLRPIQGDSPDMSSAIAGQLRLNDALSQTKSVAGSALSTFVNDLQRGKSGALALHDALGTVESKLLDLAENALLSSIFKTGVGALGSAFAPAASHHAGGIVGGGGPQRSLPSSLFALAPRFHEGGLVSGEVPIVARQGEGVFTAAQMKALAPVGSGSGSGGGNNVSVVVNNNAPGTDVQTTKRSSGGVDIHEITVSAVGAALSSGRYDGPMRARYGQQVQPRGR